MSALYGGIYESEFGNLCIVNTMYAVLEIRLIREALPSHFLPSNHITQQVIEYLTLYFNGKKVTCDIPLSPQGSDFACRVWHELCNVPYGEVRTYGEIAKQIGKQKAYRAVGMANNKNPILILIPCHRIIGARGNLVGYAHGLEMKAKLLELEGIKITKDLKQII